MDARKGKLWKKLLSSPIGLRSYFAKRSPMYFAAARLPSSPVFLPASSSEARDRTCWRSSPAVISAREDESFMASCWVNPTRKVRREIKILFMLVTPEGERWQVYGPG